MQNLGVYIFLAVAIVGATIAFVAAHRLNKSYPTSFEEKEYEEAQHNKASQEK